MQSTVSRLPWSGRSPVTTLALSLILFLIFSLSSSAQRRTPRGLREPKETLQLPDPPKPAKIDTIQLRRDAKEVADLAGSLPPDIDQVSRGMLPKGTLEKLKRIEKLSKHIRQELTHY